MIYLSCYIKRALIGRLKRITAIDNLNFCKHILLSEWGVEVTSPPTACCLIKLHKRVFGVCQRLVWVLQPPPDRERFVNAESPTPTSLWAPWCPGWLIPWIAHRPLPRDPCCDYIAKWLHLEDRGFTLIKCSRVDGWVSVAGVLLLSRWRRSWCWGHRAAKSPSLPQPSPTPACYDSLLAQLAQGEAILIYFSITSSTCPCWFSRLPSHGQGLRSPTALHSHPPLRSSRNDFTSSLSINFSVLLRKLPFKKFHRKKDTISPLCSHSLLCVSLKYLGIERQVLTCCKSA